MDFNKDPSVSTSPNNFEKPRGNRYRQWIVYTLLFWVTCIVVSFSNAGVACAQKPAPEPVVSLTAEEKAWLKAHPVITLGGGHFPPLDSFDQKTGRPDGIGPDYTELIAQILGIRFQYVSGNWVDILNKAKEKKLDGIRLLLRNLDREKYLEFTKPYSTVRYAIFTQKQSAHLNTLKDLTQKRVGVMRATYSHTYLEKRHPNIEVKPYPSVDDALLALVSGDLGAVVASLAVAGVAANRLFITNLKVTALAEGMGRDLHMGVRKDWPQFVTILNKAIGTITKEQHREIRDKWVALHPELEGKKIVALTPKERAWLRAHPDIQLGYTDTFEPEVIVNPDGTNGGILVDFLDELNRRLGTRIGLQIDSVSEILEKAKTKEVDGICNIHPEYADAMGLKKTQGYMSAYPTVFGLRKVSFDDLADFAGKKVAIIDKVYATEEITQQYGKQATILKVKDALEGLKLIDNGEADLFIGSSLNSYLLTKYQLLRILPKYIFSDYPDKFGIAIRPDWPELVSILNKGISSFSQNEIDAIVAKWVQLPTQKDGIELTAEEQAWLAQDHTVRVRVANFPPYMFIEEDGITGMVIDYLNQIAQRTGVIFEFLPETRPWQEALESLINLRGPDLMTSLSPMPERKAYMDFSEPYIISSRMIFTRTDAKFISSISDLSGGTLAVPRGTLVHKQIELEYPDIGLLLYDTDLQSIEAVSIGKADAYIGNLFNTSYEILQKGFSNLKVAAPIPFGEDVYTFGIRRDWPELSSMINKALDTITPAEKMAIRNKYLSIKYEHGISGKDILIWALGAGGEAFLIIFLFVFWNRSLTAQVRKRTSELSSTNKALVVEIADRKQKETALRESEERFRATFEQAAVGIAHVSPDGRFLRINRKFCEIVGYSHEELLERTFQDITHPDDLEADLENMRRVLAGEADIYAMEKRFLRKNGEVVWVNLTVSLLRDDSGEPKWFVSAIKDISARKQAEEFLNEARRFTDNLIQTANVMIVGLDDEGKVTLFNPAAERITGYSQSEVEGKDWFEMAVPRDRYPHVHHEFSRLMEGGLPKLFQNPIQTKSREERFISWSNNEIKRNGEVVGTLSFGIDVTESKEAERKIQEYQQKLKALGLKLTITEEQERRRIAADLHDLIGHSLALARIQLDALPAASSKTESTLLTKDISRILLKAIQDTKNLIFELSPPSMNQLGLAAAISEWLDEHMGKRYGPKTEFSDDIDDSRRKALDENVRAILYRNVRELLTNVIKHAQAERVSVYLKNNAATLEVIVEDNGIGFDPQMADQPGAGSAGFGLFSIQERMANLGGCLEIISGPGKGCRAVMSVPFSAEGKEVTKVKEGENSQNIG